MNNTIEYYNKNSQTLCEKYDLIDLSIIHKDMLDIFNGCNTLLEIGSGSGRDMVFMLRNGFDVYGIDGSQGMIKNALINYHELKNKLFLSELPNSITQFKNKFDGIFSIATLMHFSERDLTFILKDIYKLLKPASPVYISVSNIRKSIDDRLFIAHDKEGWQRIFENNNFVINKILENTDSSGRDIVWYSFLMETK